MRRNSRCCSTASTWGASRRRRAGSRPRAKNWTRDPHCDQRGSMPRAGDPNHGWKKAATSAHRVIGELRGRLADYSDQADIRSQMLAEALVLLDERDALLGA